MIDKYGYTVEDLDNGLILVDFLEWTWQHKPEEVGTKKFGYWASIKTVEFENIEAAFESIGDWTDKNNQELIV